MGRRLHQALQLEKLQGFATTVAGKGLDINDPCERSGSCWPDAVAVPLLALALYWMKQHAWHSAAR
jgi:hypothetical protein